MTLEEALARIAVLEDALRQIAMSYPVTEEGDTLATIAREALK